MCSCRIIVLASFTVYFGELLVYIEEIVRAWKKKKGNWTSAVFVVLWGLISEQTVSLWCLLITLLSSIETYKYNHSCGFRLSPESAVVVVSDLQYVDLTPRVSCFVVSAARTLPAPSPNYKRHQIIFPSVFWFASARSSLVFIFLTLVARRLYTEMISSTAVTAALVHLRSISTHGATGLAF